LAAIAGITGRNFYFQLFKDSIGAAQMVEFLKHLLRHLRADGGLPQQRNRPCQKGAPPFAE
jgi:hypothetical protein